MAKINGKTNPKDIQVKIKNLGDIEEQYYSIGKQFSSSDFTKTGKLKRKEDRKNCRIEIESEFGEGITDILTQHEAKEKMLLIHKEIIKLIKSWQKSKE